MIGFRQRLLGGEQMIGTWIKTPSPIVCEVLAQTDLDVLALDAEHAPFGRSELDICIGLTRALDKAVLVRVSHEGQILNALDCGASGVIVPHVRSAEQAASIVTACRYTPGGRGFAGSSRSAAYGSRPMAEQIETGNSQSTLVAQIEDSEALDRIDEISAVDGIDCLFIGRIDLTVALGAASPDAPEVIEAVSHICEAGKRAGRRVGMFVRKPEEVERWQTAGASLFLLMSDHAFLKSGARALVNGFRN